MIWGYNELYSGTVKKRLFDDHVPLKQVKVNFLLDEWPGVVANKCWKRELFDGAAFPPGDGYAEDLLAACSLIVKAKSAIMIRKCLYNYWRGNGASLSNTMNSRKYHSLTRTLLRCAELGRREGLLGPEDQPGIAGAAVRALLANRRDGLLTPEQTAELAAYVERRKADVDRADPRAQYKIYHSLGRYEAGTGHYGRAAVCYCRYAVRKLKYFCRRAARA